MLYLHTEASHIALAVKMRPSVLFPPPPPLLRLPVSLHLGVILSDSAESVSCGGFRRTRIPSARSLVRGVDNHIAVKSFLTPTAHDPSQAFIN